MGATNTGCDGLPRITQSQLDEEIARLEVASPQAGQNNDNSAADNDCNELIVTGARSIKRKLMADDELNLLPHGKRPRSAGTLGLLRGSSIEDLYLNRPSHKRTLYSSHQQRDTEAWLLWRLVKEAALKHPGLIPAALPLADQISSRSAQGRREMETSINNAVNLLTQIMGKEGMQQIRTLESEYTPPESRAIPQTMPWPSLLKAPIAGDVRSLALCARSFSAGKTALDQFGENLARAELYRVWSAEASLGPVSSNIEGVEPFRGEQIYILARTIGVGILALIPSHLQHS